MKQFDHEKLTVYQMAISFVVWSSDLVKAHPKNMAVHNQLDRASTSIPLNIAEGNGKVYCGRPMSLLRHGPWIST